MDHMIKGNTVINRLMHQMNMIKHKIGSIRDPPEKIYVEHYNRIGMQKLQN